MLKVIFAIDKKQAAHLRSDLRRFPSTQFWYSDSTAGVILLTTRDHRKDHRMYEENGFMPHELEQFDRNIEEASDDLRYKGLHERHTAEWLRQETNLRTKWDEHDTRMRLRDRIDHIEAVRARLQECHDLVAQEIKTLTDAKNGLDKGLTGRYDLIMNVNGECRSLCEARQGINNVHDEVEFQLRLVRSYFIVKIPCQFFLPPFLLCSTIHRGSQY